MSGWHVITYKESEDTHVRTNTQQKHCEALKWNSGRKGNRYALWFCLVQQKKQKSHLVVVAFVAA